jgi:hypothetical protein
MTATDSKENAQGVFSGSPSPKKATDKWGPFLEVLEMLALMDLLNKMDCGPPQRTVLVQA